MKIESYLVNPEMASKWLKSNDSNRPASYKRVDSYAEAMARGEWELTHQGIAFFTDGTLADGQHRLMAIVKSGKSVSMQVTWGLDRTASFGIDRLRTRSVKDQLLMAGGNEKYEKHLSKIVSIFNFILTIQHNSKLSLTSTQALEIIRGKEFPVKWEYIKQIVATSHGKLNSVAMAATIYQAIGNVDDQKLMEFIDIYKSGVCNSKNHLQPIKVRDLTMGKVISRQADREKLARKMHYAISTFCDDTPSSKLYDKGFLFFAEELGVKK